MTDRRGPACAEIGREIMADTNKRDRAEDYDDPFDFGARPEGEGAIQRRTLTAEQLDEIFRSQFRWLDVEYGEYEPGWREYLVDEADRQADLRRANLEGFDFSYKDLRRVDLQDAGLADANFLGAFLYYAELCRADLRRADLRQATLDNAALHDADLRGANLHGASILDTNFIGAKLTGATWVDGRTLSAEESRQLATDGYSEPQDETQKHHHTAGQQRTKAGRRR